MPQKVQYDDIIFFLTANTRMISDAVKLGLDADMFAPKILEDTMFIDSGIQKVYASLKGNKRLIRRDTHLHAVMKLKRAYGRLLDDILSPEGPYHDIFESSLPKLRRIAIVHMNDAARIREEIQGSENIQIAGDVISYDELHYLMQSMDEEITS